MQNESWFLECIRSWKGGFTGCQTSDLWYLSKLITKEQIREWTQRQATHHSMKLFYHIIEMSFEIVQSCSTWSGTRKMSVSQLILIRWAQCWWWCQSKDVFYNKVSFSMHKRISSDLCDSMNEVKEENHQQSAQRRPISQQTHSLAHMETTEQFVMLKCHCD